MPAFPGTAVSGSAFHAEQSPEHATESPTGAGYRRTHGDTNNWAAHDYEVYWDLARAVPLPDLGPGETR
ncbi:hypothetical protein ABZ769_05440 [Streptomyces olivoreticuli]